MKTKMALIVTKDRRLAMRIRFEVMADGWGVDVIPDFMECINRVIALHGTSAAVDLLIVDAKVVGEADELAVMQLNESVSGVPAIIVTETGCVPKWRKQMCGNTRVLDALLSGKDLAEAVSALTGRQALGWEVSSLTNDELKESQHENVQ
jgi:hypothetical protein